MTLRNGCRWTYADVVALAMLAPLVSVGCFPGLCRSRETANRVKCASNLRQIGQAMTLYANDNGCAYPRTVYAPAVQVTPTWGTGASSANPFGPGGPQPNDVSAAIFLLVRTQDITVELFVCPSSNAETDTFGGSAGTVVSRSNFSDVRANLSYSIQNMYPDSGVIPDTDDGRNWWTSRMPAESVLAADINPGVKGDNDDVTKVRPDSPARQMRQGCSNNHDEDGQNVLFGDGHVEWEQNPFVGIGGDNIYTRARSATTQPVPLATSRPATQPYSPFVSPTDLNDSVLLPTDD
jgi:prepilin-type processing-associated H-X9-DG protein